MKSVVKTDVFQYISMVILVVVIGMAMVNQTGIKPELLDPFSMSPALAVTFVLYGIFNPFVSAEVWQRIYATKDDRTARIGLVGSGLCIVFLGAAISLLGLAAKTAFPGIEPKEAAAYGMMHLLTPGLLGIGLVVLFAAVMSSVDTLVFYFSTSVAKDYYGHLLKRTDKQDLRVITRTWVVLITIICSVFAFFFRDLIAILITFAGLSMALVPPVIASFHWKLKQNAVVAALVASSLYILGLFIADLIVPEYAIASLFVSLIVLVGWQKFGK